MKYFNIAADFKKETIDAYARLNETYQDSKVIETYGNLTIGNTFEGGRLYDDIPKVDIHTLKSYIDYSQSRGIDFNYTLNGACMGNREFTKAGIIELKEFLIKLYRAGVRRLTIALPSVITLVKSMRLDFEVKASVICQITNANKALSFKRAGADRIVIDESLNRDFSSLRDIREAFGEKAEIIINSVCYKDCIYRIFHYNQIAHCSVNNAPESIISFYNNKCMLKRAEEVGNYLKMCWVRPEDIQYYHEIGINYYKLQGRHTVLQGDPVRAIETYFKQSYDGDLIDLLNFFIPNYKLKVGLDNQKLDGYIKPFFETPGFCKEDCKRCGYCDAFAKNGINYERINRINMIANKYVTEYDQFTNLLKSIR